MGNCPVATSQIAVPKRRRRRRSSKVDVNFSNVTKGTTSSSEDTGMGQGCSSVQNGSNDSSTAVPVRVVYHRYLSACEKLELSLQKPEELGSITYKYKTETIEDDAWDDARSLQKPIMHVLAEIPGDTEFAKTILSHPLIVEAAESHFVTVGSVVERPVRKHLEMGPTEYTRIKFYHHNGSPIPISDTGDLSRIGEMVHRMMNAINASACQPPKFLTLLEEETSCSLENECSNAILGVYTLVSAEVELATLDGILQTRAGHIEDHQNVVTVTYDRRRISFSSLVRRALESGILKAVLYRNTEERIAAQMEIQGHPSYIRVAKFDGSIVPAVDSKLALRRSMSFRFVPMTSLQAMKVNRLVHLGAVHEAVRLLSPRQGKIMMKMMKTDQSKCPDVVDSHIVDSWEVLSKLGYLGSS
mmetsp:Transcript_28946/g.44489  ORF Transcript_28946/g.44489 Transcript_28946/m.44489 type:complete len:415 (-) Transcript_28946:149-1393(-)